MKSLILVTGSEGLIGSRFVEIFPRKNFLHHPRRIEFDITDRSQVQSLINSYKFSSIINLAAYTDVAKAEEQRDDKDGDCWQINVEGVRNLVRSINPIKVNFIQISTDMVFSGMKGDKGPYKENHAVETDPKRLSWYGYTKSKAETVVQETLGQDATILRLSHPVRSEYSEKTDILRKALEFFNEEKMFPLITDQQITISFVDGVVNALEKIIFNNHRGVFHATSSDTTTPYDLTSYLLERTRGVEKGLEKVKLDEFVKNGSNPLRYPKYGGLSVKDTEAKLGIKFGSWKDVVDKLIIQGLGRKE